MATDIETLQLRLEAQATKFEKDMAKAVALVDKAAKSIEGRTAGMQKKVEANFASLGQVAAGGLTRFGAAALAAVGGVAAISTEIQRLAELDDASQRIGIAAESLQALQFAAQQSASSAEEITTALQFLSKEVGQTNDKSSQLRKLFEANGLALRTASGELRPFNDLLVDYARLVANAATDQEAAAAAVIGFGRSGANLVPVLRKIAGGLGDVNQAAKDAGVVVRDDLVKAAGAFDDAWNGAVLRAKANLGTFVVEAIRAAAAIKESFAGIGVGNRDMAADGQYDALGNYLGGAAPPLKGAAPKFTTGGSFGAEPVKPPALPTNEPTVIPNGSTGSSGGGGGSKSASDYARETKSINDKIEALKVEAATIALTRFEQEKAEAVQKLENAARDSGIKLTDAQRASINQLAGSYAAAVVKAEEAKKAQEALIKSADSFRSEATSLLSGFGTDLRSAFQEGASAAEAFRKAASNALTKVADLLIDIAAKQLIAAAFGPTGTALGGSGGGFIAALLAGRAGGGPVNAGQAYRVGENGPETFVPRTAGRIVPGGQGGAITVSTVIDARGADPAAIRRLEARMAERDRELPGAIERVVKGKRVRGQL